MTHLTTLIPSRLGPPCLKKRLSYVIYSFFITEELGGKGVTGRFVLKLNSRRARGTSGTRDRLSQNKRGVLYCERLSSFHRLMDNREGSGVVLHSASVDNFRFRLGDIRVLLKGIELGIYKGMV